ncbi:hypothetical protein BGX21_000520 [Mortierella sp. AD011]|nr:hypothetical protein BGX20_000515 [Mortierella sp. AD010]KAF9387589.1 hypothetical protein BGX21_000520 [Mortierella sp. AD011]
MLIQTKKAIIGFVLLSNLLLILFYQYVSKITREDALTNPKDERLLAKGLVPLPTPDPNERYLAYLPHSGFHNQRITLENAFLLAKYLNRTLLVPPVYLGPATEWRFFDILLRRIMLQTKRGLDHCRNIPKGDPFPAECLNYYSWTTVGWDFFYDMEKIREQQRWKFRADHSFNWMETHLGIDRERDIYIVEDRAHYDYQIYDDPNSATPFIAGKYLRRMDAKELADRTERVVHMGSLFASDRVLAELPENQLYKQFLRRTMILSTPILIKTSDTIVERLGGLGTFIGLHLRVGDGMFVGPAPVNIENMFNNLVNITGITPIPGYDTIMTTPTTTDPAGQGIAEEERPAREQLSIEQCLAREAEGGKYSIIYIATDGVYPRRNILFRKLFDHFPCIFLLDDFSETLTELKEMKNVDGVGLGKDLIPMVDAVVSAKARYFFGTPKSTFSTYVSKQLHPAYIEGLFDSFDENNNPLKKKSL